MIYRLKNGFGRKRDLEEGRLREGILGGGGGGGGREREKKTNP